MFFSIYRKVFHLKQQNKQNILKNNFINGAPLIKILLFLSRILKHLQI